MKVVELPFDPAAVLPGVVAGDRDEIGLRLARFIVGVLESDEGAVHRSDLAAASEEAAARLVREIVTHRILGTNCRAPRSRRCGIEGVARRLAGSRPGDGSLRRRGGALGHARPTRWPRQSRRCCSTTSPSRCESGCNCAATLAAPALGMARRRLSARGRTRVRVCLARDGRPPVLQTRVGERALPHPTSPTSRRGPGGAHPAAPQEGVVTAGPEHSGHRPSLGCAAASPSLTSFDHNSPAHRAGTQVLLLNREVPSGVGAIPARRRCIADTSANAPTTGDRMHARVATSREATPSRSGRWSRRYAPAPARDRPRASGGRSACSAPRGRRQGNQRLSVRDRGRPAPRGRDAERHGSARPRRDGTGAHVRRDVRGGREARRARGLRL